MRIEVGREDAGPEDGRVEVGVPAGGKWCNGDWDGAEEVGDGRCRVVGGCGGRVVAEGGDVDVGGGVVDCC